MTYNHLEVPWKFVRRVGTSEGLHLPQDYVWKVQKFQDDKGKIPYHLRTFVYNIILRRLMFTVFEATISTFYLTLKYLIQKERIGVVKGDQEITQKFYQDRQRIKRVAMVVCVTPKLGSHIVNLLNFDPIGKYTEERMMPTEDLKKVWIRPLDFQMTKLVTFLIEEEERELTSILIQNIIFFERAPSCISWIGSTGNFIGHH